MTRKKIQLYAVSMALIGMVFISHSGISAQVLTLVPQKILADTLVGENPFIEGLELIATEGSALIVQYYQLGGEKLFPLNPNTAPFDNLDLMYIISSNQENWKDYWPRSIWEFRDGSTIVLQFSQDMESSLEDGALIVAALNSWMGTTLDVLYGIEEAGKTTIFYWGYMSAQNHSDFIYDEFYTILSTDGGGYTNFITRNILTASPLSVVGTGILKNQTGQWAPVAVAAFIQEDAIAIDQFGVQNMSISSAFGYTGDIRGAPDSIISAINFQLPYVAVVYDSFPSTDNLYPELTGKFDWTIRIGTWIDYQYKDIFVTYKMETEGLDTFPQITSDISVDIPALHSLTDPILNASITIKNSGTEKAYNTTFVWELGENEPEEHNITIFDADLYTFDKEFVQYFNYSSGLMGNELAISLNQTSNQNQSLKIAGWFINKSSGLAVQPITSPDTSGSGLQEIDIVPTLMSMYTSKSFVTFEYSNNLTTYMENETFYLIGSIKELNPGESEDYWWTIGNLPSKDDRFIVPEIESLAVEIINISTPTQYTQINVTLYASINVSLQDWIVQESLNAGEDLRYPPIENDFIPGVMFFYQDYASREFFGWSNGLVIQLYDEEAVLKTTISLNSSIYEMHEWAEINVTIENIGDAPASDVQIQGFYAQLGPGWELKDLKEFSNETIIGTIDPGQNATYTFLRQIETFIGIHPVGIVVDYTTEKNEGTGGAFNSTRISNLASNLLVALVMPKDETGEPQQVYPTPVVNVSVSWNDENGEEIENGDIVEIKTTIKNLGDEFTTIKVFSYFPTRMASIIIDGPYNGNNFKVTDPSGNLLTGYDQGFALDHPIWPISVAAVAGLHLAPGETIIFYYKLNVTDKDDLIVPPVEVEYDSRFPMVGTSGIGVSSEDDGGGNPIEITKSLGLTKDQKTSGIKFKIQQATTGSSTWTSYSSSSLLAAYAATIPSDTTTTGDVGPTTTTTQTGVNGFTTLRGFIRENMRLMIVVLAIPIVVLIIRERRRRN